MNDTAVQLHHLFKDDWEWSLEQYPETATFLGDSRYNDRLTDLSPEAIDRSKAHERQMLDRIRQVNRSELDSQDALSYDLFLFDKELKVESQRFPIELLPVSQMDGPQIGFARLAASMPFETAHDYENYIHRLEAFPKYADQIADLMRRGIHEGWTPAAIPLRSIPAQIEGQITDDLRDGPLYKPFKTMCSDIPPAERTRLQNAGDAAVRGKVNPALSKFAAFIASEYLPACRKTIAASSLRDGAAYYQFCIRHQTTTDLTAQDVYEIGKREVARIRSLMEQILHKVGFSDSFQEFLTFLRTDSQFFYSTAQDLIAGYAAIAKRIDGELPRLFTELPRTPYGIREIPPYEAPAQTTAYYMSGAADGSRAGYFYVNTYKLDTRPKYEMEALSLHEAVPGHHLQIARAQELKTLPAFRRNAAYTAYVEGWALYAESLGDDIDFYSDAYSKFGQLTYEMWRACRLVVDTGIHALGWTRQQAMDYLLENTAKTENDIGVEVDRYIVWPAQALSYKLGEIKIKELRALAHSTLRGKFDLRRFNNALLDDGPLPLNVLDRQMRHWIRGN